MGSGQECRPKAAERFLMQDDAKAERISFLNSDSASPRKIAGKDFKELINKGTWFKGKYLKAVYRKNEHGDIRYGFSVSGKAGNAVKRNLFKRRIKQLIRETYERIEADIVIFPAGNLERSNYQGIKEDYESLKEQISN